MLQQTYTREQLDKDPVYKPFEVHVLVKDYGNLGKGAPEGVFSSYDIAFSKLIEFEPTLNSDYPFAQIGPFGASFRRNFLDSDGWYIIKYTIDE